MRFLGLIFDSRLTWREHVQGIVKSSKGVLNIMRCLTGREWGAHFISLKYIYIALIGSRIDYGSVAYGSAAKSVLAQVDIIQSRALRICLGAMKTAPVCSLPVEAGEMPLWIRRKQLTANYWIHLKGHKADHPTKRVLGMCWERGKEQKNKLWVGQSGNRRAIKNTADRSQPNSSVDNNTRVDDRRS